MKRQGANGVTVNCEDGRLEVAFPAVEAEASRAIASLHAGLSNLGLPGQKTADIKIVLAEAINNVVEHAYAERAPGMVRVSVLDSKDYLEVQITDTGHPLPGLKMPDGIPASVETDASNLPEGGFGWFLIRTLADEVRYDRRNGQNLLFLRFERTKKADRPQ